MRRTSFLKLVGRSKCAKAFRFISSASGHRQAAARLFLVWLTASVLIAVVALPAWAAAPRVIELTQTGCQFLEPEQGYDHGFKTKQATDCVLINAETAADRLTQAKPLVLKPGRYIFRVRNSSVPYQLGFYLRASSRLLRALRPKVVGGGIDKGESKDYAVELTAGQYLYSCPLNPTPDYPLIVKD
jgi:hypothetical protein